MPNLETQLLQLPPTQLCSLPCSHIAQQTQTGIAFSIRLYTHRESKQTFTPHQKAIESPLPPSTFHLQHPSGLFNHTSWTSMVPQPTLKIIKKAPTRASPGIPPWCLTGGQGATTSTAWQASRSFLPPPTTPSTPANTQPPPTQATTP